MSQNHGSAPTRVRRIPLRDGELAALIHATEEDPTRVLVFGFGPAGAWITSDDTGEFPTWSYDMLARMRNRPSGLD